MEEPDIYDAILDMRIRTHYYEKRHSKKYSRYMPSMITNNPGKRIFSPPTKNKL